MKFRNPSDLAELARKAFLRVGLIKNPLITTIDKQRMLLHPFKVDNAVSVSLYQSKIWEPLETRVFKEILKPGMLVADLGANIGYYTLLAAQCIGPKGRVIAFEPAPDNFELLQKNIHLNHYDSRAVLINKAVGGSSGNVQLYLSPDNKGDHRTYDGRILDLDKGRHSITVQVVGLDDFFSTQTKKPDVIKMDIQGYEPTALRGMQNLLAGQVKLDLFTEVWPKGLSEAGSSTAEYVQALVDYGFDLLLFDHLSDSLKPVNKAEILELAARCADDLYLDLLCRKG